MQEINTRVIDFLRKEELLTVELAHGKYDSPLEEDEWIEYELEQLRNYISNYILSKKRSAGELYPIKEFVQQQKFKKVLARFDDYLSMEMFDETVSGGKVIYEDEVVIRGCVDESGETHETIEYPDDFDD